MITVFQCVLISLISYLGYMTVPWVVGPLGGWYVLSRPLVSGMIIGAILGDVTTGVIIGAAVQVVFIALVTPGTSLPSDLNAAAYIGVTLGIISVKLGGTVEAGVAISTVVGSVGTIFYNFICLTNEFWNKKAGDAIEAGDTKKLYFAQWIGPQITTFLLRFIPTFVCIYYGQELTATILAQFPVDGVVMRSFNALGGILPAVGIAMLLHLVIKENLDLVYFLFGFGLVAALGLNTITLTIIAVMIVYLYYKVSNKTEKTVVEDNELEDL